MRLSDLLGAEVLDPDGRRIGHVHDVRLVQDGPILDGFGAALRLDGLIVGRGLRGGFAIRLGYHRQRVNGPYLLDKLALALERRARFVVWADVASCADGVVRVARPAEELPGLRNADSTP